MTKRKVILNVE